MLVGEHIQRIQSAYSKGVQSQSTRLTPRHIYNKMLSVRIKVITLKANKKQGLSQWNYQTIPCIEMVKAPLNECPCLPPMGCEFLKSKYPLPKPIVGLFGHLIQRVSSFDMGVIYSPITPAEINYKKGSKYTSQKPDYFIENGGHLFTLNRIGSKVVSVTGIFEEPWEVKKFPSFCPGDCKDCDECQSIFDMEFPIDGDLVDVFIELCAQELIDYFSKQSQDLTNNSSDDSQEQAQQQQQQQQQRRRR